MFCQKVDQRGCTEETNRNIFLAGGYANQNRQHGFSGTCAAVHNDVLSAVEEIQVQEAVKGYAIWEFNLICPVLRSVIPAWETSSIQIAAESGSIPVGNLAVQQILQVNLVGFAFHGHCPAG